VLEVGKGELREQHRPENVGRPQFLGAFRRDLPERRLSDKTGVVDEDVEAAGNRGGKLHDPAGVVDAADVARHDFDARRRGCGLFEHVAAASSDDYNRSEPGKGDGGCAAYSGAASRNESDPTLEGATRPLAGTAIRGHDAGVPTITRPPGVGPGGVPITEADRRREQAMHLTRRPTLERRRASSGRACQMASSQRSRLRSRRRA
jgi:hypothetical protein